MYESLNTKNEATLGYEIYSSFFKVIVEENYTLFDSSTRYNKLLLEIANTTTLQLNSLKDKNKWKEGILNLCTKVFATNRPQNYSYNFLLNTYENTKDEQRKNIAEIIIEFVNNLPKGLDTNVHIYKLLLKIVSENKLTSKIEHLLKPIRYEDEYNFMVINEIKQSNPNLAISYCKEIVSKYHNDYYYYKYIEIIEELLEAQGNSKELLEFKKNIFEGQHKKLKNFIYIKENSEAKDYAIIKSKLLNILSKKYYLSPDENSIYFE